MGKLETELRRKLQALYAIALDFMSEEEARALFCSITRRGRGKRGPGRNLHRSPTRETERKRRTREGPPIHFEVVRALTKADIEWGDQYFIDRMNAIADKK